VAKGKSQTERLQLYVSLQSFAFLELLAAKGTHGTSISDVARTLIEEGIRTALEKGHLTEVDRANVQNPKG